MIHFSPLELGQIESLALQEALATSYPWSVIRLKDSFQASADCRAIKNSSNVIGYCVLQRVLDEAELLNFVVFEPFQSRGFGQAALALLQRSLKSDGVENLFLEVRASNAVAQKLYRKAGFEKINIRCGYYPADEAIGQSPENALVMRCRL